MVQLMMNGPGKQVPPPAWWRRLPGWVLFRTYQREWLPSDVLAGVSVCVVMIPSVIAYAGLMGLAPQHGLYAALGALPRPSRPRPCCFRSACDAG